MDAPRDLQATPRNNADIDLNAAPVEELENIMNPDQDPHSAPPPPPPQAAAELMEMEQGGTPNPWHPQLLAYIYGLQEQLYKVTMEKEMLKRDALRLHLMLNIIYPRNRLLTKENEALKKKIQEVSAFFR